eukprot:444252-Rhodomonas_salina.1
MNSPAVLVPGYSFPGTRVSDYLRLRLNHHGFLHSSTHTVTVTGKFSSSARIHDFDSDSCHLFWDSGTLGGNSTEPGSRNLSPGLPPGTRFTEESFKFAAYLPPRELPRMAQLTNLSDSTVTTVTEQ